MRLNSIKSIAKLYQGHLRQSGPVGPLRLTTALIQRRRGANAQESASGARFCPCCGWHGRCFLPYISGGYVTFDAACPRCGSHARHRGHRLFYDTIFQMPAKSGKLLYFAPEQGILPYFRENTSLDVVTADLDRSDVDLRFDMQDIPLPEDSIDLIVCHRVIEHVADDRLGMRELFRILKPGGEAVISVPITAGLAATVEFGRADPLQDFHYYDYGRDFTGRIPPEFNVRQYTFSEMFDAEQWRRMALYEDLIFVATKPAAEG